MQTSGEINFDLTPPAFNKWELVAGILLFVLVLYGVLWWSRRRAHKNSGSLRIGK